MRIAYACYWNAFAHDGVATKINAQTRIWRDANHEVEVFCVTPARENGSEQILQGRTFAFGGPWERPQATARMLKAARASGPDVLYLRYDHFFPTPGRLLHALPSVVEVNGPLRYRGHNALIRLYSDLNRTIVQRGAHGFVAVCYSLADMLKPIGKPVRVVPNGVDLDSRQALPTPSGSRPRYAFLAGARSPWHGIDKVLGLAEALPDSDFTLIGLERDHLGRVPPENVSVHGRLARAEYEPLLAQADVAIGSVAMERAGLHEASTLKFPEYLSYGLPVIIGYDEAHFRGRDDPWYLLRLPTGPDNVRAHVGEIRAFTDRVRGRRVQRAEVADIIGKRPRETQRLEFLAQIAAS